MEVPLGELISNKEIERTYDLVDGKNNPTLVSKETISVIIVNMLLCSCTLEENDIKSNGIGHEHKSSSCTYI